MLFIPQSRDPGMSWLLSLIFFSLDSAEHSTCTKLQQVRVHARNYVMLVDIPWMHDSDCNCVYIYICVMFK